jgi:ABC-type antimicrobial peptide transport system permease subunit
MVHALTLLAVLLGSPLWTPMALTPPAALMGAGIALAIGLVSGLFPGWFASRLSVVDGLRKVA